MKKQLVVLISGNGSNLQAIIDAIESGKLLNAQIVLVISNKSSAFGLERAKKHSIPSVVFPLKPYKNIGKSRMEYDEDLAKMILDRVSPDLIVLAGWMHILSPAFLSYFENRVINLHPALPGAFDGINAIERAYHAFQDGKITKTGIMVHFVIPEVDRGKVIKMTEVEIKSTDSLHDLEERIHASEHFLLVEAIETLTLKDS